MSAADGFAFAMLGILILTLGTIGWMLFFMLRSSAKCDRDELEVDKLLDEVSDLVADEESTTPTKQPKARPTGTASDKGTKPAAPWEREEDWWKKP